MPKKKNSKKNDTKYNADNEIIIGVTTKPKEKVRVEKKKTTRTNKNKTSKVNSKKVVNKNKKNLNTKKQNIKTSSNNELTKEEKIKKLNIKRIIISIIILLFLVACGTIYYLTTPVFNISSIKIYGNQKNSVDTYISLSRLVINETNIFGFTNSNIVKRLKENPYVENVKVERKLPNIVELYITERTEDYQVNYLNSYVYLNNQGYILEINENKKDIVLIEGLTSISDNTKEGQRLTNEDLIKLDTILKVTNYLKYNSVESKLTKVDVTDEKNYTLEFKEENKIVYLGDSSSITEKMTSVENILEAEKGKKGKIYANEEVLKKNRVYFKEDVED